MAQPFLLLSRQLTPQAVPAMITVTTRRVLQCRALLQYLHSRKNNKQRQLRPQLSRAILTPMAR